ncbi:hypothetical protein HJB78_16550 [Rhizobium lentis]|uniref:hypothetical protein n=1 Tax=Rhizobium lentis TaxID=1138194 RepID=UPI001C83B1E0|nr:hypothetical protein [Rhizobium lentis]MBX5152582.1 hypothetical protein [Rhizobium lentis]
MIRLSALFVALGFLAQSAHAEVLIDITENVAKEAVGTTTLDDLSINDTALIYSGFCVSDGRLYIPGWTAAATLASDTFKATGVMLRVTVLPGKKLKGLYVDAAQAQQVAKGDANAAPVISKDDYNTAVRRDVGRIFVGGTFGTQACEQEQHENPLRKMTIFEVESVNGQTSLSALLKSVAK